MKAIWPKHLPLYWLRGWLCVMVLACTSTSFLLELCVGISHAPACFVTFLLQFTFTWTVWILGTNQNIEAALAYKTPEKSWQRSKGSPYPPDCLKPIRNPILCNITELTHSIGQGVHCTSSSGNGEIEAKVTNMLCFLSHVPWCGAASDCF